jgi:hypothetical protein
MRSILKKERNKEMDEEKRDKLHQDIIKLKEDIWKEEKQTKVRKIKKVVQEIRCFGGQLNGGAFWKLKRKLTKKKIDSPHAVYNKAGEKIEDPTKIKETYQEFYRELLKERAPTTKEEEEKEKEIKTIFENIMRVAETQEPIQVTDEEVQPILKHLKKRKASDKEGWRNEMLIEGGDEMVKSVRMMTNQILDSEEQPNQWTNMIIRSIHKKKDIK